MPAWKRLPVVTSLVCGAYDNAKLTTQDKIPKLETNQTAGTRNALCTPDLEYRNFKIAQNTKIYCNKVNCADNAVKNQIAPL